MRTRKLGPLEVTVVGLGCNNFGGRVDEAGTAPSSTRRSTSGVTFFDTADIYGNRGGSETLLGGAHQGRRDQVVLATKFGKRWATAPSAAARATTSARRSTRRSSGSRPTRSTSTSITRRIPSTPLEETFGALKELVDEGQVRASGRRTTRPRRSSARARSQRASDVPTSPSRASTRGSSAAPKPSCCRPASGSGSGSSRIFPLASGLLTGKVSREHPPAEGTRLYGRAIADGELDRVEALRAWAEGPRLSLLDVADRRAARPVQPVVSVIAGATKPEQVRANAQAGAWEPTADELAELLAL